MRSPATVSPGEWTRLEAGFQAFGDTSTVDIGNLVQWTPAATVNATADTAVWNAGPTQTAAFFQVIQKAP